MGREACDGLMEFEPKYYADKLRVLNPTGDVGVVTLWSRIDQVVAKFREQAPAMDSQFSRIAVIGNLYGNGLPHMLRNLLWNPQLRHLLVLGQDLAGSKEDLVAFFRDGTESALFLGSPVTKIKGRNRVIDGTLCQHDFRRVPLITCLGPLSAPETAAGISEFFGTLPDQEACDIERRFSPVPEVEFTRYPAEPSSHTITRRTPIEAWRELVFRLYRFGYRVKLAKGTRWELLNVKVVITAPAEEPADQLAAVGFDIHHFKAYQQRMLDPEKPADLNYTYGNRLRGPFMFDLRVVSGLDLVVKRLRQDINSRHAYIALWDTKSDLPRGHKCPCLVSVFFRYFEGKLTMTATFRTHNVMDAWLENVWGLMAVQCFVADLVGVDPGSITVISHSISISEDVFTKAGVVAGEKKTDEEIDAETGKRQPRMDHNGNFTVTVDEAAHEIVVHHVYEGMTLHEYRGRRAEILEKQIARDCAVSEISHALYLGREIARAERRLKKQEAL